MVSVCVNRRLVEATPFCRLYGIVLVRVFLYPPQLPLRLKISKENGNYFRVIDLVTSEVFFEKYVLSADLVAGISTP